MISAVLLDSWLNKNVTDICLNGYNRQTDNHCAHFVAHVLSLNFGYTCRDHTSKLNPGANLRVHEIFARCTQVKEIRETNPGLSGLVFVSAATNFVQRRGAMELRNVPRKHIGILLEGLIWHYSNTRNRVVKQPMSQFLFHYPGQTNALWLGTIPPGARALWFGSC